MIKRFISILLVTGILFSTCAQAFAYDVAEENLYTEVRENFDEETDTSDDECEAVSDDEKLAFRPSVSEEKIMELDYSEEEYYKLRQEFNGDLFQFDKAGMASFQLAESDGILILEMLNNAYKNNVEIVDIKSLNIKYNTDNVNQMFLLINESKNIGDGWKVVKSSIAYTSSQITKIVLKYSDDTELLAKTEQRLDYIVEESSKGKTDLEKALIAHDLIVLSVQYDYENLLKGNEYISNYSYSTIGALGLNMAVCAGYASAYSNVLNKLGIKALYVTSNQLNHAWNLIKIDGKYYYVDCTWDDPIIIGVQNVSRVSHTYFLCSEDDFQDSHNADDYTYLDFETGKSNSLSCDYTDYDNSWIKNIHSQISLIDGSWYYTDSRFFCKKDNLTNSNEEIVSMNMPSRYVSTPGNIVYFADANKIYVYTIKDGALQDTGMSSEVKNYGVTYFDNQLFYCFNPKQEPDYLREIEIGGLDINKYFRDSALRKYVSDSFDKNSDGKLSEEEIEQAKEIDISSLNVQSLQGLSVFAYLEKLNLSGYEEKSDDKLDFSIFNALNELTIENYKTDGKINLGGNVSLKKLYIKGLTCQEIIMPDGLEFISFDSDTTIPEEYIEKIFDGDVETDYNGVLTSSDGSIVIFENGKLDSSQNGYCEHEGKIYNFINGIGAKITADGAVQTTDGVYYYVDNGQIKDYTGGIVLSDVFFQFKNGVSDDVSGIVNYNGVAYYIENGVQNLQFTKTIVSDEYGYSGLAISFTNGKQNDFSGITAANDEKLYLLENGVQTDFTGAYRCDGSVVYLENGAAVDDYTGFVLYNDLLYKFENGIAVLYNGHYQQNDYLDGVLQIKNGAFIVDADADLAGIKYYTDGKVSSSFAGFALCAENGNIYYFKKGKVSDTSGIISDSGKLYVVENGILDRTATGIYTYSKVNYLFENGQQSEYTGLEFNADGNGYYFKNGKQGTETGIFELDNVNYYVVKGVVNTPSKTENKFVTVNKQKYYIEAGTNFVSDITGVVKVGSSFYYVEGGINNTSFNGYISQDGTDYYFVKGVANKSYTGLAKDEQTGEIYYFKKGVVSPYSTTTDSLLKLNGTSYLLKTGNTSVDFTATGIYTVGGKAYNIKNGALDELTGVVTFDGNKYYVEKGIVKNSYTGLAKDECTGEIVYLIKGIQSAYIGKSDGLLKLGTTQYFIELNSDKVDTNLTGICTVSGKQYYIKNGAVDTSTGIYVFDGVNYCVVKGVVNNKYSGIINDSSTNELLYVKSGVETAYSVKDNALLTYNGTKYIILKNDSRINQSLNGIYSVGNTKYCIENGKISQFTGSITVDELLYSVKNGKFGSVYTGFVKEDNINCYHYFKKGVETIYSNADKLVTIDKKQYLFKANQSKSALIDGVCAVGTTDYYFTDNTVDTAFIGVASGKYFEKGKFNKKTGIVKDKENLVYVEKGVQSPISKASFLKYDKKTYYLGAGSSVVDTLHSGLVLEKNVYYYVVNGEKNTQIKGLVTDELFIYEATHSSNTLYYVSGGKLDTKYNGCAFVAGKAPVEMRKVKNGKAML